MWIFEPEPKLAECKSCGARIVWATTTNGASCPLIADYDRLDTKTITVRGGVKVTIISVSAKASHFAYCPQANQFIDLHRRNL